MGDGVTVKMAKRKSDGAVGIMSCEFAKPAFNSESAGAWMKKQKFSVQPAELFRVEGVEIFSTGLWNGKQISEKDLTAIAESYSKTKGFVRPALKLGHDDDQKILQQDGLPAAGWIENVRKVGTKLVADFADIPKKIYQLILNRAYRKVSCEIYNNLDIEGTTYPKLLGAVALLGSDLPGVLNLNDIVALYASSNAFAPVEKFAGSGTHEVMFKTSETPSEDPMPNEVDQFKAKAESAEKERDAAKADALKAAQEAEKFKQEAEAAKAEAAKLVAEAAAAAKKAKIDAFVSKIQADKNHRSIPARKPSHPRGPSPTNPSDRSSPVTPKKEAADIQSAAVAMPLNGALTRRPAT